MKQRVFSMLLAIMLVFTSVDITAFAQPTTGRTVEDVVELVGTTEEVEKSETTEVAQSSENDEESAEATSTEEAITEAGKDVEEYKQMEVETILLLEDDETIVSDEIEENIAIKTVSHTADEALAWVKSLEGQAYDYDKTAGAQCVDLIQGYYNYLGVPTSNGNGCDYATNTLPAGWQRIQGGIPQKGDILVYSGNSSNKYGHVAIFESEKTLWHGRFAGNGWVQKTTSTRYDGLTNPYWGLIRPDWDSNIPETFPLIDGQYYYIWNHNAGLFMDSEGDSEGARVVLNNKTVGKASQMWKAVKQADGYTFISGATGYAMDVYGYSTENCCAKL